MTDYGRSPGSEPWHSDDPLYGDQGWDGQQAVSGQVPYDGQAQQQYPQQPYSQQPQEPQQPYGAQDPYQQQYGRQGYDGQQQYAADQHTYGGDQQQYGTADPYAGAWDTGGQAGMPYTGTPADPLGGQPGTGYPGGQADDHYATPEAYPPPQPPGRRHAGPEAGHTSWDAEAPEEEKHAFFTDNGLDDDATRDDAPGESREPRRRGGGAGGGERRGKGKKKSRNGCACLVVSLVLVGGLGGAGYVGYQFLKGRFGAAEDYSGAGSGSVTVEIPKGAGLLEIGSILKKQGVVKSAGAFVSAANKDERAKGIQDGVYLLAKEMSGANAVKSMLDPKSRNVMIIPEGKRNSFVYAQIDKRLGLKAGSTKKVAQTQAKSLGLPSWAGGNREIKDPLEGFLFPASYPVAKGMKPEAVLRKMVARANEEFGKQDLQAEAERLGLKSPLELLTVASLVQAEGKFKQDFDKVSRVVYNRLQPENTETVGRLEFDSTVNYIKNQSTLDIGSVDSLRSIKDPYNTYSIKGLPPGPIGNPGLTAFNSALDPTPGPWYYFVSITEDETLFAETNEEHESNRRKYQEQQENSGQ
ncbi:endolytic transglycosylase MltG [Streptomyces sp. NPDC004609]|uniref:endolytic transglycosylase MltG n=1 Tax=Streptomyces sp. NPDC004609 TaxID=3364704 RepID=UPI0036C91F2A